MGWRALGRWARAGALSGACAGFAFAALHQVFVAVAPVVFLSVLPGAVFGLALTLAFVRSPVLRRGPPLRAGLIYGASIWVGLVPFFAVVVWAMHGRVWEDGPLPAAKPFLLLAPLVAGAIVGTLLTRQLVGAVLLTGAMLLVSKAVGGFLLVDPGAGVFRAMAILLPSIVVGAFVLSWQTQPKAPTTPAQAPARA